MTTLQRADPPEAGLAQAKQVAIWGFGREGRAAFDHLRKTHPHIAVTILNDSPLGEAVATSIDATVLTGPDAARALTGGDFDVVIKSPGISLYRPEIAAAKQRGVRFTSTTNLWFERYPDAFKIAVTGTKGKSTTTRMLHHLLRQSGLDFGLAGNVGIPVLELEPGKDGMVLELSSYQLADLEFAPQMAVVTNLYPEHGPWHGGIEPYYRDKLRALTLSPDTVGVCNFASDELKSRIADRPNTHWFNGLGGFRAGHGELLYGETPVACTGYPLKGDHNLANLAAVATVADLLGLHGVRRHIDLGGFAQLPHRLEELPLPSGILAINDSISTVPEATIAALNAYPGRDVVLLLGGDDRGQAYDQLIEVLRSSSVHSIILLPKNGARILAEITAAKLPINTIMVANLTQGVGEALRAVRPNGAILLSPAAPSFGEFANFEERGNLFKTLCKQGSGL